MGVNAREQCLPITRQQLSHFGVHRIVATVLLLYKCVVIPLKSIPTAIVYTMTNSRPIQGFFHLRLAYALRS